MRAATATSIRQLRPSAAIDAELDWYFNRAECDMGNQSNYIGMLGRHGPGSSLPSPEDAVLAAHRHRCIRRCLLAVDTSDAGVLQCAYELRDWPVLLWDHFGRLGGVIARLACAEGGRDLPEGRRELERLERERADWVAGLGPHDPIVIRLARTAGARFARAHQAYGARRGPAQRRPS